MKLGRHLFVGAIGLVALASPMSPVLAETIPAVPAATLVTAITPSDPSPRDSRVVLSFSGTVPLYSITSNDGAAAVITFTGAGLGPALAPPSGAHGLIQSMSFAQKGGALVLTITGGGPIHVTAADLPGRAVALEVTDAASGTNPWTTRPAGPSPTAAPTFASADEVFEVVPLKYADVSEIVGLLTANQTVKPNDNFTPQEPAFGSAGFQGSGYSGYGGISTPSFSATAYPANASTESVGQAVDDITGIDRRLNAIILKGPADRVARLKAQIVKLDVPVTSVLLETVFVELTESGARNIGLDFNNANNQIATVAYSFTTGGFPGVSDTATGGAVSANLQAAIYAQIAKGNGRIISKPRIAAQSGSTAKIITGDALPILTSIALSGVNAVQQQVQYVNVGVTLQIAPRVSEDGFVTSHVFAEVSSVTGFSQGYPTISQREASTSATVRDGDSFIIGGLSQESLLAHHNKIPGVGDVPLLGEVFRSENSSRAKTDLYIVVTPHIVRGRDAVAAALAQTPLGR